MPKMNFQISDQAVCANCKNFNLSKLLITPVVAGSSIGYSRQSTYNLISNDNFPIPVVEVRNRKMVRVIDLIKFIEDLKPDSPVPIKQPRRPGRPSKEESIRQKEEKNGGEK